MCLRENFQNVLKIFKKHGRADICSIGTKHKYWKTVYSAGQNKMHTIQRHILNTVKHLRWSIFRK